MSSPLPVPKLPLSKDVIEDLKSKGLNQTEIARMYGVSRQAVSWHLKTYGGQLSIRQIVDTAWPFATSKGHDKLGAYKRLRDHGEFMLTRGEGMNDDKIIRLRSWWRKLRLEGLVVEFDPRISPLTGAGSVGSFAYRDRIATDGDLLIRVNQFTNLSDRGNEIWRWPEDIDALI